MAGNSEETGAHGRFGYVSDYDPTRHMARIQFHDKDNLVSAWIPVAIPNSLKNKDEMHLDIGEHVYCNMMGNGLELGVVLCSVYDRKKHLLKIECVGDIEIHAAKTIKLTASRIDLN